MIFYYGRIKQYLSWVLVLALLLPSIPLYAGSSELEQLTQRLKQGFATFNIPALKLKAQRLMDEIRQEKIDTVKKNNQILWSIPAAFDEKNFDTEINQLHVKVPFYDEKFPFPEWLDKEYKDLHAYVKENLDIDTLVKELDNANTELNKGMDETRQEMNESFADIVTGIVPNAPIPKNQTKSNINIYANMSWLDELKAYGIGKRLIGLGLYRSDLSKLGFLAANFGAEYLFLRDIKQAKYQKVKACFLANHDKAIELLEKVQNGLRNPTQYKVAKKELANFIGNHCRLFRYNPLKKEVIVPMAKYLLLQRAIGLLRYKAPKIKGSVDHLFGYVKNDQDQLVRSAVTPISLVTVAEKVVTPVAAISQTLQETMRVAMDQAKFGDKFFNSRIVLPDWCYGAQETKSGLPLAFYEIMSGITGESLLLLLMIKIIDGIVHQQFIDALVKSPTKLIELLKRNKQLSLIDLPTEQENKAFIINETKLEREIGRLMDLDNVGFFKWGAAKRGIFSKIALVSFACFVLPTVVTYGWPIASQIGTMVADRCKPLVVAVTQEAKHTMAAVAQEAQHKIEESIKNIKINLF